MLGLGQLAFALAALACGAYVLRLSPSALTTLAFLTLVFAGQATIYAIRVRGALWETPPGRWLVVASLVRAGGGPRRARVRGPPPPPRLIAPTPLPP